MYYFYSESTRHGESLIKERLLPYSVLFCAWENMFNLTLGELLKTFRNLTNLHHNERTICFIFLKHRSKHGGNMPSNPNGPQKKNFFFENWQWTKRLTSRADPILTVTKMTTTWSIWCISLWYVFLWFRTDVPWHFYMKQASILLY